MPNNFRRRRSSCRAAILAGVFYGGVLAPGVLRAEDGSFLSFKVPGSAMTIPEAVNARGTIVGYYFTGSYQADPYRAFLRSGGGALTLIHVPGAGEAFNQGTWAADINDANQVVGSFTDAEGVTRAFLRESDGTIQTFGFPGAAATYAEAINTSGHVVGSFTDGNATVGFLREPDGELISITPQDSVDTVPLAINSASEIVGAYRSNAGSWRGFLRAPDGTLTSFEVPGATLTIPTALNTAGAVIGYWVDGLGVTRGFVRHLDRTLETFGVPGAAHTFAFAFNRRDEIVGYYYEPGDIAHSYIRRGDGTITTFGAPGATSTGPNEGTFAIDVSASRRTIGYYTDETGISAFIRTDH